MLRTEVKDFACDELAKYDFLVERITALEAEQVETRLRPEESKLKGLQQTLASYQGTLHELHKVSERRHKLTHKAEGSFDLLGRKHKQRKVEEQREKEQQACEAELAQKERVQKLTARLERQREVVVDLRRKIRELDAVRQAELDFVDRLFRGNGLFVDADHDALEDAVCSLAPRLFKMREGVATHAVGHAKLDSAVHQLEAAAEELEHAFEPAHRILKDRFGDEVGEEFFVSAGHAAQLSAVQTAVQLVEAASQNIYKAKERMDVLPGLHPEEVHSLSGSLKELSKHLGAFDDIGARKLVRDCVNAVHVVQSQAAYAAQLVSEEAAKTRQDLQHVEAVLGTSKSHLDFHRRSLLSQVQEAKRSNSLRVSAEGSLSGTLTTVKEDLQERWARRLGVVRGMGDKVPSVNSGLSRLT